MGERSKSKEDKGVRAGESLREVSAPTQALRSQCHTENDLFRSSVLHRIPMNHASPIHPHTLSLFHRAWNSGALELMNEGGGSQQEREKQ